WLAAHGALGAITAQANGGNAGAGALSAAGAELVVSIAAEKMFGDKALDENGKFNAALLNEGEKKQLSALGAATGAALGLAAGGNSHNAQTGGVVAQNAVENNAVDLKDGKSYSIKYADTVNNRERYSEHVLLNEEIKRKSEDFTRQAYNCNSISSCEYWLNRFNALYVQYNKAMKPLSASKDKYKQQQHYFLVTQAHELLNSDIRKVKERLDIYKREEANKPSRQADYSVDRQAPERIGVYMLNGVRTKGVANDGRFAAGLKNTKIREDYYAVHTGPVSTYIPARDPSNIMVGIPYSEDIFPHVLDTSLYKTAIGAGTGYLKDMYSNKTLRLPTSQGVKGAVGSYLKGGSVNAGYIIYPSSETRNKLNEYYTKKREQLVRQGVYDPNPKLHYSQELDNIWKEETNNFLPGGSSTVSIGAYGANIKLIRTTGGAIGVEFGAGTPDASVSHGTTYKLKKDNGNKK
ncbi:VENN motif pre-toxin domain-containing protein, partial [Conchiformibius steedae]